MDKKGVVLMHKYEVGRLLGQGAFAKVYHARNLSTAQSVAIKVIDKEKVVKVGLFQQIKREISIMRLVRHPNIVHLHEVMANKAKIYFVMEYVKGGELFDRVARGKLKEDAARKYFQQLIGAVDFCHSRGVYHRDLKPENLLVDENGNLKVSDFGLSALMDREKPSDGLLHTTCGTPAYVAPEVINTRSGYDGAKADIWSSGVVLFVLMAGYLPFQDANLVELYRKIRHGEFKCPYWFPSEVKTLLSELLDPNPSSRITIQGIMNNPWFLKGYKPAEPPSPRKSSSTGDLSDVDAAFNSEYCEDHEEDNNLMEVELKPHYMNAFDIISFSPGFNLSRLFETNEKQGPQGDQRFATQKPAETIISRLREVAEHESFEVKKKDGTVNLRGSKEGRKGHLSINAEIFEVTPAFYIVEVNKSEGDTLEYQQFFDRELRPSLKDIVWLSNSSSSSSSLS